MSDKNSLLPSTGSSSGPSRTAHIEATADAAMRGRSRSPITDVPPRGRRSRSPSLDPRYPTLRRDWYAARKDKWYAEDMEWWRGELKRAEERQASQRQQGQQQQQQQQQLTPAASELGSSAMGSVSSSSSANSGSTSALDPPTGVETATRTLAPRRTLYDEAWSRSANANAAMVASCWSAEFAAQQGPQRQREQEQKHEMTGEGEEQKQKVTAGIEEQEQPDENGSRARVRKAGEAGEEGEEAEDIEPGNEGENERRKGKQRDAKL